MKLHFNEFGIEANQGCTLDQLTIYEGYPDSMTAQPLANLCGFTPPDNITVNSNKAMLFFQ